MPKKAHKGEERVSDVEECQADGGSSDELEAPALVNGAAYTEEKLQRLLRKVETILAHRTDRVLLVLERVLDNTNYVGCLRTAELLGIQNVWVVQLPRGHKKAEKQQQGKRGRSQVEEQPQQQDASAAGGEEAAQAPAPAAACMQGYTVEQDMAAAVAEAGIPTEDKRKREIKKRIRFSRQSAQWLDVRFFWSVEECITALRQDGWTIWATDLSESSTPLASPDVPLPDKLAVVMGREADGVSQRMLEEADRRVHLQTFGFNGSLNVMVATGMVLQQVLATYPQAAGQMSGERKAEVRKEWYNKLASNEQQRAQLMSHIDNPPPPYESMSSLVSRCS